MEKTYWEEAIAEEPLAAPPLEEPLEDPLAEPPLAEEPLAEEIFTEKPLEEPPLEEPLESGKPPMTEGEKGIPTTAEAPAEAGAQEAPLQEASADIGAYPAEADPPIGIWQCLRQGKKIWKDPFHRRRLRAASALLFVGIWGITYLCARLFSFLGLAEVLQSALGGFAAGAISAGIGFALSLLLLYPLWLGMLSYAGGIGENAPHAETRLFSYYTERRKRVYALRQGLFHVGRFMVLFAAVLAVGLAGGYFGNFYAVQGDAARAALLYGATVMMQILLPLMYLYHSPDFILTRRLCEGGMGIFAARGLSIRRMQGKKGKFLLLLLAFLPAFLLSLPLLGIGIPLWVLPRFVLAATVFSGRPT